MPLCTGVRLVYTLCHVPLPTQSRGHHASSAARSKVTIIHASRSSQSTPAPAPSSSSDALVPAADVPQAGGIDAPGADSTDAPGGAIDAPLATPLSAPAPPLSVLDESQARGQPLPPAKNAPRGSEGGGSVPVTKSAPRSAFPVPRKSSSSAGVRTVVVVSSSGRYATQSGDHGKPISSGVARPGRPAGKATTVAKAVVPAGPTDDTSTGGAVVDPGDNLPIGVSTAHAAAVLTTDTAFLSTSATTAATASESSDVGECSAAARDSGFTDDSAGGRRGRGKRKRTLQEFEY